MRIDSLLKKGFNMKKIFIVLLCALFVLSACSNDGKDNDETTTTKAVPKVGKVDYKKCGQYFCATIKVPLDYSKPKGRKIDIAIRTAKAQDPEKRIGILLVNPGGPGASGAEFVESVESLVSKNIRDSFDIVGWDPRGVGDSSKPACSTKLDYLFTAVDYSPDDEAEKEKLIATNKQFGEECVGDDKDLAAHIDTIESAKDMDEIRQALGEKKINYLGYSYGTALGQIYSTLFPKNYRSIVIDGVLDVGSDPLQTTGDQAIAFEKSFESFFDFCRRTTCKFANGQDPKIAFTNLESKIELAPIKSSVGTIDTAQFMIGTSVYMYGGEAAWPSLDAALKQLSEGDTSGITYGYELYVGRDKAGNYNGEYASFLSILCADGKLADSDELFSYAKKIGEQAPLMGESTILLGIQCSYYPHVKAAKAFKVDNSKGKPVMVVGTTGDPATPIEAARRVAKKLNSSYIEFKGEGHTAYGRSNSCVDDAVEEYLLKGKAPKSTINC